MIWLRTIFLCGLASTAWGQDLRLPSNAVLTSEESFADSGAELPIAPWRDGQTPVQFFTGDVTQRSWRIDASGLSSEQVMRGIREQLLNAEFDILFSCETTICGGFDFRFSLEVTPPPAMHVNLSDYRYLTAIRGDQALSVLASRTREAGFLQITQAGTDEDKNNVGLSAPSLNSALATERSGTVGEQLNAIGRAVLDGLQFERGSSRLGEGPFATLGDLAQFLSENPTLKVALVGHTDSEGSLDGNIGLSKRRAASVLERLVADFDIKRSRLEAQGMGYLAPIASNLTGAGREANRRVEVIVTSIEN